MVLVHADAEAHADYTLLARRERGERARGGLAQVRLDGGVDRQDRVLVLDEIAEVGILLVADRGFQRQWLLGDLEHPAHLLERHAEFLGKLLGRGLAADLVEHLARLTYDFADALHHVHGDADGARLVGDRARDRLPDPPRGVGREFVAAAILEFVDRLHQADIAFLDQVEELQAAVGVFLGDGDDEAQVRFTISFLAWRASRSPFCTVCTILRNSPISSPVSPASTWISWRCCLTFSLSRATRLFQPFAESFDTRLSQRGSSSEPW